MKFRFPIVIIDEDYRSENTSGLGIRALADAIVSEGLEVLGVTSYGDLSQFAQQQKLITAGSRSGPGENSSSSIDKMNALRSASQKCRCADLHLWRNQNLSPPAQ